MNNMPVKLRQQCAKDPYYRLCARQEALHDHECAPDPLTGKLIEWEHAMMFAGKQIQELWAIVPACWLTHRGPEEVKEIHVWIALNRATDDQICAISKAKDYFLVKAELNKKYGVYVVPKKDTEIQYPWMRSRHSVV